MIHITSYALYILKRLQSQHNCYIYYHYFYRRMLKRLLITIFLISLAITVFQFWSASETQRSLDSLSNRIDDNEVTCSESCQSSRNDIDRDNTTSKHNLIGYWVVLCSFTVVVLFVVTLIISGVGCLAILKENPTKSEQLLILTSYTGMISIFNAVMVACIVTIFTNSIKKYSEVPDATFDDMNRVSRYGGICFGITIGHCVIALVATIIMCLVRRKYKSNY